MKKYSSILAILLFVTSAVLSQTMPADISFYKPDIKPFQKIITEPVGNNHAALIQSAIDLVAGKKGGTVIIGGTPQNHTYIVGEITLKSNVHITVQPGVIFKTNNNNKEVIFSAGKKSNNLISNFSLTCTDSNQFFYFDFTSHTSPDPGVTAVSASAANNFKLADFKVSDNNTKFSSITFNLADDGTSTFLYPTNAIVEHIEVENAHYGYGVIQCQLGKNLLFRNLKGSGGATLRLESGSGGTAMANLIDPDLKLDGIYATDIYCSNGQAAVTLSPHTIENGKVTLQNLTAKSCEAGAIIASGFLSSKSTKSQADAQGKPMKGYKPGFFDNSSSITNLKVIYGTDAQLRGGRLNFVPCNQRGFISAALNPDGESYKGPTVAAIVYFAKGGTAKSEGFYEVKIDGLSLVGFPEVNGKMENKQYITSNAELIKNCPK